MSLAISPIFVASVPPPVAFEAPPVTKKCSTDACTSMIVEGKAFVASENMVTIKTREEVLAREICFKCLPGKAADKTFLLTRAALDVMVKWADSNAHEQAMARKAAKRAKKFGPRVDEDMLDTIKQSAQRAARLEARQKHGRPYVGTPKPAPQPGAPKNYGDQKIRAVVATPSKPQKGKNKNKGGKKGR